MIIRCKHCEKETSTNIPNCWYCKQPLEVKTLTFTLSDFPSIGQSYSLIDKVKDTRAEYGYHDGEYTVITNLAADFWNEGHYFEAVMEICEQTDYAMTYDAAWHLLDNVICPRPEGFEFIPKGDYIP